MTGSLAPATWPSLVLGILAFAADRLHKAIQIDPDCIAIGASRCISGFRAIAPPGPTGWRGGEIVPVTGFFDYVLVWNTGISYGLLSSLPVLALGLIMVGAIVALAIWWIRSSTALIRAALALAIGGALSNALDRLLYGAVADFFHFHWGNWSFYIFNLADAAITIGVLLLILDVFGLGRRAPAPAH